MITLLEDVADLSPLWVKCKPRHDRIILRHLMEAGGWVSICEFEDVIWGDDEDGGPLNSSNEIAVHIFHLRRALKPGFSIESDYGRGSRGYRLVVEQEALERLMLENIGKAIAA